MVKQNSHSERSHEERESNKRVVERLFQTLSGDDLGALDALVSESYVGPQGEKGAAGFRGVMVGLRAAFPDLRYVLDDVLGEGDEVAVRWHWIGTHKGPFRGHPATGKTVTNNGLGIFHVTGGKVTAGVLETDRLGFLQQIGAIPEAAGVPPRSDPRPR